MMFTGLSPDESLVEIVELKDHPWFLAVQYHPEFKSKPIKAQSLFSGFINAAIERQAKFRNQKNDGEQTTSDGPKDNSSSEFEQPTS